jgi:fucose 4-O-acetylase-like acetyltransferase
MMVQLVPTLIFLLLLAPPPFFFHQLGAVKGGYWFTFVLFEFFVLYMLIVRIGNKWSPWVTLVITIGTFYYASYYHSIQLSAFGIQSWVVNILGFLSVTQWRFFLFFYIGTWVRRHFDSFIHWTNKPVVLLFITVVFLMIASTPHFESRSFEMLRFYVSGITGMWMVFTAFRLSASWLQKLHLSKPLQYVGTRTLDIYLLHFFFLPRFLETYTSQLKAFDSQFLEFLVIMAISLIILALCLLASYVLRLSPFAAKMRDALEAKCCAKDIKHNENCEAQSEPRRARNEHDHHRRNQRDQIKDVKGHDVKESFKAADKLVRLGD